MKLRPATRLPSKTVVVFASCALAALALATLGFAADWPQYRGPQHSGATTEPVAAGWPESAAPREVWRVPVGEGFGSFAVAGGKVFLMMERDRKDVCVALDPADGSELWATPVGEAIFENQGGNGPRTTPVVDGTGEAARVYVLGTYLNLLCLNAADGQPVWQHDVKKEYAGQDLKWGNAASPVVDGDLVYLCGGGAGQTFLAFNKSTGDLAWKGGDEKMTHATPTPATIHGVRQIIFFTQSGLVSVKADTGEELWRFAHPYATSTASTPIVGTTEGKDADVVYCSAGYGQGTAAARIVKGPNATFTSAELWRHPGDNDKVNHWTTPVYHDGHLYGIYGFKQFQSAPLKCLDLVTGETKWSQDGFGSGGSTILAGDGHLIALTDYGKLVVARAAPDAYHEVGSAQILSGKCWTMPALADGRLYARSTTEAVCLDVSVK